MAIQTDLQIEAEGDMALLPVEELTALGFRIQNRLPHLTHIPLLYLA